jgi:hypothetical protein
LRTSTISSGASSACAISKPIATPPRGKAKIAARGFSVEKLDLRIAQVSLSLHDRGLCLLRLALVQLRELDIAFRRKLGRTPRLLIGADKPRLGRGELRFSLVNCGFERLFLDREDDLALLDIVAVLE